MERYFQRKSINPPSNNPSSSNPPSNNPASSNPPSNNPASSNQPSNNPSTSHPQEFNDRDLMKLEDQLGLYIVDMQSITEFSSLNGITDLAEKLVNTGRSRIYNYVYLLLTLALVLPVATASVERAFSAMNIVKTPLRNKMGNQWLSDSLVVYIEKDVFSCISNANIMRRFHDMKPRRQQL